MNANDQDDSFIKFANGLMNETNALVATTMDKLVEIKKTQVLMNTPTEWNILTGYYLLIYMYYIYVLYICIIYICIIYMYYIYVLYICIIYIHILSVYMYAYIICIYNEYTYRMKYSNRLLSIM